MKKDNAAIVPSPTAVRGKYFNQLQRGTNLVILDPVLMAHFPDSESVNNALHAFLAIGKEVESATIHVVRKPVRGTLQKRSDPFDPVSVPPQKDAQSPNSMKKSPEFAGTILRPNPPRRTEVAQQMNRQQKASPQAHQHAATSHRLSDTRKDRSKNARRVFARIQPKQAFRMSRPRIRGGSTPRQPSTAEWVVKSESPDLSHPFLLASTVQLRTFAAVP